MSRQLWRCNTASTPGWAEETHSLVWVKRMQRLKGQATLDITSIMCGGSFRAASLFLLFARKAYLEKSAPFINMI